MKPTNPPLLLTPKLIDNSETWVGAESGYNGYGDGYGDGDGNGYGYGTCSPNRSRRAK